MHYLAAARGATILGEVLSEESHADARYIAAAAPGGTGAIACMKLALDDTGLSASDIPDCTGGRSRKLYSSERCRRSPDGFCSVW